MTAECKSKFFITAHYPDAPSAMRVITHPERMISDAANYPNKTDQRRHLLLCQLSCEHFRECLNAILKSNGVENAQEFSQNSVCTEESKNG